MLHNTQCYMQCTLCVFQAWESQRGDDGKEKCLDKLNEASTAELLNKWLLIFVKEAWRQCMYPAAMINKLIAGLWWPARVNYCECPNFMSRNYRHFHLLCRISYWWISAQKSGWYEIHCTNSCNNGLVNHQLVPYQQEQEIWIFLQWVPPSQKQTEKQF